MTVPITTLRETLKTALTNAAVWDTFSYPPATLTANSVVITPADPYVTPSNNTNVNISPMAHFKIVITVPMFDNQGALVKMEDYIDAVFKKIAASSLSINVSAVSGPGNLSVASGEYLTTDITIDTLTSWS
jgi:hypothetical protein